MNFFSQKSRIYLTDTTNWFLNLNWIKMLFLGLPLITPIIVMRWLWELLRAVYAKVIVPLIDRSHKGGKCKSNRWPGYCIPCSLTQLWHLFISRPFTIVRPCPPSIAQCRLATRRDHLVGLRKEFGSEVIYGVYIELLTVIGCGLGLGWSAAVCDFEREDGSCYGNYFIYFLRIAHRWLSLTFVLRGKERGFDLMDILLCCMVYSKVKSTDSRIRDPPAIRD